MRLPTAAAVAKSAAKAYGKRNAPPFGAPTQMAAAIVTATPAESVEPARRVSRKSTHRRMTAARAPISSSTAKRRPKISRAAPLSQGAAGP